MSSDGPVSPLHKGWAYVSHCVGFFGHLYRLFLECSIICSSCTSSHITCLISILGASSTGEI